MRPYLFIFLTFLSTLLLLSAASVVAAVTCNPMALSPCADAILKGAPPTAGCCGKLRQQRPCFCQYQKNPSLQGYINSPNSKKVASACGVPIPSC
ncbi:non-specific lipid-transfer protein 2-like [Ananas comosus]|uniref:Non-specific lipid-transfer protein 2 n=1 Tax=Ananas comosus TaxID=4615 RepID=A0A199VST0_ANACO|nr:non-specific lipid-transfer protein 2-like [Ananas comosus]XP_020106024.1 non-specific lipid-transfer protein 2-like [Ananas comosus]OAY80272.1 Non-specific lipid-transfer protein 2 [Ananas comosus]